MKVICISGKSGSGKDYCANIIKEKLIERGNSVLITHYADLLKYICKQFFEWNGVKDIEGRSTLQHVGTDVVRAQDENYWVNFLMSVLKFFPNEWDYVLIPDCRFPNEIEIPKENFDVVSVRINNVEGWNNALNFEQQNHESETALDNYIFNHKIINQMDETINDEINKFIEYLYETGDE